MGMLTNKHNILVEKGQISHNSIVQVNDFMINAVNGDKKIIIVLEFDVLNNPGHRIGNPKPVTLAPAAMSQDRRNGHGHGHGHGYGRGNGNDNRYTNSSNTILDSTSTAPRSTGNPYSRCSNGGSGGGGGYTAPIMRNNAPLSGGGGNYYTPIKSLNPYTTRWTIMGRITNKSDIKHWSNSKGDGQLFSIEILDSSMDIRATFFREGVDKFYNMLECDKVYTFTGGKLKVANMQYNTCKCQFEITFDQNSEIHLQEDTGEITQQLYEFQRIADLERVEAGKYVDIVGIVKHVSTPSIIVSKNTGRELQKCELTVVDDSGAEVSCTVWGDRAANATKEFENMPVVAFRRARVSDFGGRTLSAASGGNGIIVQPRVPELNRIMNWWQQGGSSGVGVKKLSSSGGGGANRFPEFDQRKTISAIKAEGLGRSDPEKPDWISFKGTVSFIKSDRDGGAWYTACANTEEPCKNRYKVQQGVDGRWFCDKCNQSYDNCVHRFIFSATISDASGTTWVSVFDDQAKVLLNGMTADELYNIHESSDPGAGQEGYEAVFKKAHFTEWIFTCKVKQEMVNDEVRLKTSIQSLHKMDYIKEGRSLLNSILAM